MNQELIIRGLRLIMEGLGENSQHIADASKPPTLEEVRGVLADKAQAGKPVKELIAKYDAVKLTDIDPKHYVELLKEAEGL